MLSDEPVTERGDKGEEVVGNGKGEDFEESGDGE
jgi:hypothetical protein